MFIFKATDITQQKKAYRILEQICGADSESSLKFVVSHLKELQDILLKTLASSSSASKTVSSTSSAKYNWWTYYTIQDYFVKLQKTRTGYIHSIGRPQIHLCRLLHSLLSGAVLNNKQDVKQEQSVKSTLLSCLTGSIGWV